MPSKKSTTSAKDDNYVSRGFFLSDCLSVCNLPKTTDMILLKFYVIKFHRNFTYVSADREESIKFGKSRSSTLTEICACRVLLLLLLLVLLLLLLIASLFVRIVRVQMFQKPEADSFKYSSGSLGSVFCFLLL